MEDILATMTRQFLPQMTREERSEALLSLRRLIDEEFIDGFHGVATRRLWNYLAWFKWIWSFRRGRTARQAASLVVKQVGASPYKTTWRNCKRTPYPFYDYWVKQAKRDATARAALPLAMGAHPNRTAACA